MNTSLAQEFECEAIIPHHKWWQSALMVFAVLCFCTLIGSYVANFLDHENVIMIYLLGVVWIASQCGFRAALASCLLSIASYDWFILPPSFSILPSDPQQMFTFAIMAVVAVVLARLTDSLRMHAKLRGQQAELLDLTNDAVFVWSLTDFKIAYWNTGAEKMFGITRDQVLGRNVKDLLRGSRAPESFLQQLLEQGQWNGEVTYQHTDGTPMVVASRLMIKRGEDKSPIAVVEFCTDISERKVAETRIREFYSIVSHELRTPLTSVFGSLRLLESGTVQLGTGTSEELINISRIEIQKVIGLVNDILDLQKMESGMLEIHVNPMSSEELLRNTCKGMQVLADQSSVELIRKPADDVVFNADYNRILQVMTNLTANAIKFTPSGGTVTIQAQMQNPEKIRFSVEDTGCGIDEKQFPKLFKKFQQLDSSDSRQFGGTGLGLVISKSLVEQHGGAIGVDSIVGQGTTFWFDLPIAGDVKVATADAPIDRL
ncbi:MAG: DUF4118 domain-containing protein [Cyanobacteria bacterium SZAS-4]|nr:DUF4118 domain-containing protein [Cyanobacteria bacterium SZAS-4]